MDKTHADWLLTSQECLVKRIDASLSTEIIGRSLFIKRIPAFKLAQMEFITNTDQNNNYMYLENLSIYKNNSYAPLNTTVIEPILIKMFASSDSDAFVKSRITHSPFLPRKFKTSTNMNGTLTQFIYVMSTHLPKTLCSDLRKSTFFFDITLKINE
jgi:hypothetical protein